MAKTYTVSDGKLTLRLRRAEEGGYVVTSPFDSELITQAEDLDEAFINARDALKALNESRSKLLRSVHSRVSAARALQNALLTSPSYDVPTPLATPALQ